MRNTEQTDVIRVLKILTAEKYEVLGRSEDVHAVSSGTGGNDEEYLLGVDAEHKLHIYGGEDDWICLP